MQLLDIPTDVPKVLPQCRLRTGDPQMLFNLRQVFAVPVKESPHCLIRAPACYQSVLIFAAFPPRTSPPCFNMNEWLPRLGLKPTGSFHSREKEVQAKIQDASVAWLHMNVLLHEDGVQGTASA